ncbi:hypothetical protein UA08_06286 [Talaromyces atroroseus]|uniref:Mid2 domain-containing protein n=1 Tax=Talaromyces atroroseus TaxID=1441469 RepID=A0A225AVZ2_TALAT|nr:hypothetical protein UA08_06286 [Talaromyces atroroseus]OKL58595.1 hypothetical protein UA08_06286 [Talaromyces atroroseus]
MRLKIYSAFLFAPLAMAVCYYPNGYSESSAEYQPCYNDTGRTSMCCGFNRTNPSGGSRSDGATADICLPNGLCENDWTTTDDNGTTTMNTAYFRDQCTVSDWTDAGCLNVCTSQTNPGIGSSSDWAILTPCDGTSNSSTWCCGSGNTTCCDTAEAITLAQVFSGTATTTATTSSSTSSATSTITSSSSAASTSSTSTSTPSPSSAPSELSSGAKAGVGVGVAVGGIAIIFGVLLFFLRRRQRTASHPSAMGYARPPPPPPDELLVKEPVQELNSTAYHEMDSLPMRVELDGMSAGGNNQSI